MELEFFKKYGMVTSIMLLCFAFGIITTLQYQSIEEQADERNNDYASITWKYNHFKLNESNLRDELEAQGVKAVGQAIEVAICETDSFRNYACKHNNNLFGLKGKDGTYIHYNHWTESVEAYQKNVKK